MSDYWERFKAWSRSEEYTGAEDDQEEAEIKKPFKSGSVFSTALPAPGKKLSQWLEQNADLPIPTFTAVPNTEGISGTMDQAMDAFGMDSTQLKQQFSVSTQNLPEQLFSWYVSQSFIGYQACAIISQNWLVNKALMIPAKDAVRNGYTVTTNGGDKLEPETLQKFKDAAKKYKINQNLIEFDTNKRRFGIRIALFVVESNDEDYYKKPFNIDGVTKGSYKGISQIDPQWMAPVLDDSAIANPVSMDFYEPTWWQINGTLYHKSHLAVVRYVDVADVLKPSYQYGGLPLTQLIMERVYAAERMANEIPMLAETKRLTSINVDVGAIAANPEQFEINLARLNYYRDNYGIFVQGLEEKLTQHDTSLTDLDVATMTEYQLVASVAGVPATKLIETSPKGFNATGEFEAKSYDELLENTQTDMDIMLDRHHQLIIKSEIAPDAPFDVETIWNPVDSPSAKELAEIRASNSISDRNYVDAGAVDGTEVRNRLIEDPNSGYNGLEPIEIEEIEEELFDDNAEDGGLFGYVSATPDRLSAKSIFDWAFEAGIDMGLSPEKMHITLAHDKTGIPGYMASDSVYDVDFTGEMELMGEGEDRGLCLFVDSPALQMRHGELKGMGAQHKFLDYRPHLTVKYEPTDSDLDKAKAAFDKFPFKKLSIGGERIQLIK